MNTAPGSWLVTEPSDDAPFRLFCLPHAGAGASTYRTWSAALSPAGVGVTPVQLPGRENRFGERALDRLEPIVDAVTKTIMPHSDRPFALFGHSMGALIAFEVTRSLRRRGAAPPAHLYVSGRMAPQLREHRPVLHHLSDRDLVAELRELGGIHEAVLRNRELLALHLPVVRADLAVNETYRHQPELPLDVPITAFGGDADPKVDESELLAWRTQTAGPFRAQLLPGGHFFLTGSLTQVCARIVSDFSSLAWRDATSRARVDVRSG